MMKKFDDLKNDNLATKTYVLDTTQVINLSCICITIITFLNLKITFFIDIMFAEVFVYLLMSYFTYF